VRDIKVGVERRVRISANPNVEGGGFLNPGFCRRAPVRQFVISKRKVNGLFFMRAKGDALEPL
jgi:hypothetical protein